MLRPRKRYVVSHSLVYGIHKADCHASKYIVRKKMNFAHVRRENHAKTLMLRPTDRGRPKPGQSQACPGHTQYELQVCSPCLLSLHHTIQDHFLNLISCNAAHSTSDTSTYHVASHMSNTMMFIHGKGLAIQQTGVTKVSGAREADMDTRIVLSSNRP